MDKFQIKSILPDSYNDVDLTPVRHFQEDQSPSLKEAVSSSLEHECSPFCYRFLELEHVTKHFGILTKKPASNNFSFLQVLKGTTLQVVNISDSLA